MSKKPSIINGNQHTDKRGKLLYNNKFDINLLDIKRCYCIQPKKLRAWHGHRHEQNWFMPIEGLIKILLVKPDNWENPSFSLPVEEYTLEANVGNVFYVPGGYVTGINPITDRAKLMVFSDFTLEESLKDDYRFAKNRWYYETFM